MKNGYKTIIEHFQYILENPHEYAKSWTQRTGQLLSGFMCTHIPEEILYAAGILPVRILSSPLPQAITRSYVHETYCSYSHGCAYQGLQHNYDYLDLIVMGSTCFHISEAFNVWIRFAEFQQKSYLIQFPHLMHNRGATEFLAESFGEFKQFIEKFTGKSITNDDLKKSIEIYNYNRSLLRKLWEFLKRENPPITGLEAATVTLASQVMDKQECNQMLIRLIQELETEPGRVLGIRLMAIGGACDDLRFFDLIEHLNYSASLIFSESCTGARYFWFEVPENRPDKLGALAEGYLSRIPCAAKDNVPGTGERKRLKLIQQLIEDFRPDGIMFTHQRFCSPHPHDAAVIKQFLDNLGIPSYEFELDSTIPAGQFKTRLEALIETLPQVTPLK